jgi:hypothetical protein
MRSTDGDIAADGLRRIHVGKVGAVVAPVHPQHRRLNLRTLDDLVAEIISCMLKNESPGEASATRGTTALVY